MPKGSCFRSVVINAAPGSSHSQVWSVYYGSGEAGVDITDGSDVFSVDRSTFLSGVTNPDSDILTITFSPPANATGTFVGTIKIGGICNVLTFNLTGTVAAASGVAKALPSGVSITVSPNPATDYIAVATSNARSAEIEIFDMLGKEIASSKTTDWNWDASRTATGSYIVRIVGESFSGDPFVISRRIIIAR